MSNMLRAIAQKGNNMQNQMGNSAEMGTPRKNKIKVLKIKKLREMRVPSMNGLFTRPNSAKARISELEYRSIDITPTKTLREENKIEH